MVIETATIGSNAIAAVVGMLYAFFVGFLPGGKIVEMVSDIVIGATVLLLAFGAIFSGVSLSLLTGNTVLSAIFFAGVGFAAASTLKRVFGL